MVRIQLIFIVALTLASAFLAFRIRPGIDLAGGAELRYKVLYDSKFQGDRRAATREATDVVRRRLEAKQLQELRIMSRGDDEIVVQLPGVDAEELRDIKRLIGATGDLKLYAVAPQDLQERFDRDQVVPDGYKSVGRLLVERQPVIEGRHIVSAEPRQTEDARWVTSFELDADGARRFDDAAERLYRQHPRGRIAIVLDGVLKSAPVVESPAFHGRGQISVGSSP